MEEEKESREIASRSSQELRIKNLKLRVDNQIFRVGIETSLLSEPQTED